MWLALERFFQSSVDKEQIITMQPFRGLDCTRDVKLGKAVPPDRTNDPFTPAILFSLLFLTLAFIFVRFPRPVFPTTFCVLHYAGSPFIIPSHPSRVTQVLSCQTVPNFINLQGSFPFLNSWMLYRFYCKLNFSLLSYLILFFDSPGGYW